MADISQVKLPNGDTYNLVDETSGYGKIHIISYNPFSGELEDTYEQIKIWIEANEIVVIYNVVSKNYSYFDKIVVVEDADEKLVFRTLTGFSLTITSTSIIDGGVGGSEEGWLTLATLPIYDGTVV